MDIDFQEKMAGKDTDGLLRVIEERKRYVPDAIEAAIAELKKRGHVFSEEEFKSIESDVQIKKRVFEGDTEIAYTYDDDTSIFPNNRSAEYYSKRAIIGFSVFFGTIVGAILFAINVRSNKQHVSLAIVFGALWMGVIYYVQSLIETTTLTILLNGLGGYFITGVLWPRFLGHHVQYKAKEIWWPLSICIILVVLFLYFVYNFRIKFGAV